MLTAKHKMEFLAKQDSGSMYRSNGKYQLYTVEMFDYIFMNAYNSDFVKGPDLGGKSGVKTKVIRIN